MDIERAIAARGGLVATHELLSIGCTGHHLTRLTRSGVIVRVRQGWYSTPALASVVQQAVRVGGILGCVSAARVHGLAVLEPSAVHVCLVRGASRLRDPEEYRARLPNPHVGVITHWSRRARQTTRMVQDVAASLETMASCQHPEQTIAAVDSALRRGLISRRSWARILDRLPDTLASPLSGIDRRAESITESIARVRLRRIGYEPSIQVGVASVGRVDMMLGGWLVLEFDGWEYHGDRRQFEEDRRRDAVLAALGYRTLRFSYRQVIERWGEVERAIARATR